MKSLQQVRFQSWLGWFAYRGKLAQRGLKLVRA